MVRPDIYHLVFETAFSAASVLASLSAFATAKTEFNRVTTPRRLLSRTVGGTDARHPCRTGDAMPAP